MLGFAFARWCLGVFICGVWLVCLGFGGCCFGWGLVACWCLGSLIAFWGFCFDLLGCYVNSVVFMVYVCVFVLCLGVLRLIVYCSMLVCVLYGWLVDCALGILFLVVVLLVLVVGCLYVSYCWLLIVGGCLGCFCGCYYCVGFGFVLFLVVLLIVVGFGVFMVADLVWVLRIACCLDYALLACLGRLRLWCCWVRVDGWFDAVVVGCVVCFELVKLMLFVI